MRSSAARTAAVAAAGMLLAGCSETGFQDIFGAGKYSPDETQVQQNQALSVPPDLQLRPPSNAAVQEQPPQTAYVPPQPAATQPPPYQEPVDPDEQAYTPPPAEQAPAPQTAAPPQQDVYARLGISKTRPDGSPKSQGELNEELRQKKIAAEKAKNPNYGSVWNMGNVWSDSQ